MDDANLTRRIVDTLSNSGDINALLTEICESTGMHWADAEALVARVRDEHAHVVAGRQLPLMAVIAFGIFLGGLAATGYGVFILVQEFILIQANLQNFGNTTNDLSALQNLVNTAQIILQIGFLPFSIIIMGASMLLGSLSGMRDTWSSLIDKFLEARNVR